MANLNIRMSVELQVAVIITIWLVAQASWKYWKRYFLCGRGRVITS